MNRIKSMVALKKGHIRYMMAAICLFIITAVAIFALANEEYGYPPTDQNLYTSVTIQRGQSLADALPMSPETIGLIFSHWSLTPDGDAFDFNQSLYETTTFYAIWHTNEEEANNNNYIAEAPDYNTNDDDHYHNYTNDYDYTNENYDQDYMSYTPHSYDNYYGYDYAHAYDYGYGHYENEHTEDYGYYNNHDQLRMHDYDYDYDYLGRDYTEDYWYDDNYHSYGYIADYSHNENYYDYGYTADYSYEENYHDYGYTVDYPYEENYHHYGYIAGYSHDYDHQYEYANDYQYEDNEYYYDSGIQPISSDDYEEDIITIYFMWNRGISLQADQYINIFVDDDAFVLVYPEIDHSVTVSVEHIYVRFPARHNFADIGVNMPGDWTYEIQYEFVRNEYYEHGEEDRRRDHHMHGDFHPASMNIQEVDEDSRLYSDQYNTYTVVTIYHDIATRPGPIGFVPFASGIPGTFTHVPLVSPVTNTSWINALATAGDLVISVPEDIDLTSSISITGNRTVVITSFGTNLQGNALGTHIAPPQTFTIGLSATAGRHFQTSGAGNTLILSHIIIDGGVVPPASTFTRGGLIIGTGAHLHMLQGSIIRHNRASTGAGVNPVGAGTINMTGNATITENGATSVGGGIGTSSDGAVISGLRSITLSGTSSISNNRAPSGAGVNLGAINHQLTLETGTSVSGNIATTNGGGVRLQNFNTRLFINGGNITGNSAINGGGVSILHAAANVDAFTFTSGSISNNTATTASGNGGGIFTEHAVSANPLPMGSHQGLTIGAAAVFSGNVAGTAFTPPTNAAAATNIANRPSSGGHTHPLNNLDISFNGVLALSDWSRLNAHIQATPIGGTRHIIIFPAGSTPPVAPANTYHFVIQEPQPAGPGSGSTITTVSLMGGVTPHVITATNDRNVTVSAADGANIYLRMPRPNPPAPLNVAPWTTNQSSLSRHFHVDLSAVLTVNGIGSGTLTLYGDANTPTPVGNRGGVFVVGGEGTTFILGTGGIIRNNRASHGGGINISFPTAPHGTPTNPITIRIDGGEVIYNHATTHGGGIDMDGLSSRSHLYVTAGRISHNFSANNGGGVATCCNTRQFYTGGEISHNIGAHGGGVHIGRVATPYNHVFIHGTAIHNNISTSNGGGVHTGQNTTNRITMTGGSIHSNSAASITPGQGNGGGIFHQAGRIFLFGGTINDNHASGSGGGIFSTDLSASALGEFVMDINRPTFSNHLQQTQANPHYPNGTLTINGNRAQYDGGGVSLAAAGAFGVFNTPFTVCDRVTISGNSAGRYGGGILIGNATRHVYMTGGIVSNNGHATTVNTNTGTAAAPILTPVNINIHNGGGLFINDGNFTMFNGDIDGNAAMGTGLDDGTGNGGGIHIGTPDSTFILADFTPAGGSPIPGIINIINNSARVGGGLHYFHGTWDYGTNTGPINFIGNTASERGGALAITGSGALLTIDELWTINNNTATGTIVPGTGRGGGVHASGGATINMTDGTINDNRARYGAGVDMNDGNINMSGGTISNNRFAGTNPATGAGTGTPTEGGGVRLSGIDATFTITGGTIGHTTPAQANRAGSGGGVWVSTDAYFIMATGGTGGIIRGNSSTLSTQFIAGGGVHVAPGGTFEIHSGQVIHNTSTTQGGGIMVDGGTMTMSGGTVGDNISGASGGGVALRNGIFNMSNGFITNNLTNGVNRNGGGVLAVQGSTFTMTNGTISGNRAGEADNANTAQRGGGGVNISDSTFTMSNGIIENNRAMWGGGVIVRGGGEFNMTGGTIRYNTQTPAGNLIHQGGGVHVSGDETEFNMTSGSILRNRAVEGGGVHVRAEGEFTMSGGTIGGVAGGLPPTGMGPGLPTPPPSVDANVATRGGGVAVVAEGTFIMEAGGTSETPTIPTIVGNQTTASHGGGGVLVAGIDSTFDMYNGIIERNAEPVWGGGVLVQSEAEFVMRGGEVRYHVIFPEGAAQGGASGVGVRLSGQFTMHGGQIHGNINNGSGAGVNLQGSAGAVPLARFTMHGGEIHNNEMFVGTGGGGLRVYNPNAQFIMNGGYIRNNTSHTNGGGVAISHNTATMTGGTIRSNIATGNTTQAITGNGGGVFINSANLNFNMSGGTIGGAPPSALPPGTPNPNRNFAANNGGGIWVGGAANLVVSGTNPKSIIGNFAEYGGGAWIQENSNMTMPTGTTGLSITYNQAIYMGGGIYTQRLEYANPLTLVQGALNPGGVPNAYSNLSLLGVHFNNNVASRRYVPPINATTVLPNTIWSNTSIPTSPTPIRNHPLNNYDINFSAPGVLFRFHKTNQLIYANPPVVELLPGARFKLFRTDSSDLGGTGSGGLVPADLTGTPWQEVTDTDIILNMVSTAINNQPISFYMTPGFIYQLVEYEAPNGYQIPLGQWRLIHAETNPPTVNIVYVGNASIPVFIPNDNISPIDIERFLGNHRTLALPMTGGYGILGNNMTIGVSAVVAAMCIILIVAVYKHKQLLAFKKKQ